MNYELIDVGTLVFQLLLAVLIIFVVYNIFAINRVINSKVSISILLFIVCGNFLIHFLFENTNTSLSNMTADLFASVFLGTFFGVKDRINRRKRESELLNYNNLS